VVHGEERQGDGKGFPRSYEDRETLSGRPERATPFQWSSRHGGYATCGSGCTAPEIVSITGHTLQSATRILEKYLARTKAISGAAILKFENAPATDLASQLQTADGTKKLSR